MSDTPEFLQFSADDVLEMGIERNADAPAIAEALKTHRSNLETWGRENAPKQFWQGSAQLDRDTEAAMNSLRQREQQRLFQETLRDPREQEEFVYQMEAGGYDPDALEDRFKPLAKQMDELWASPAYSLDTTKIHGGSVDVNGTPLARYSLRRGTSNGKVDVSLTFGEKDEQDFIQVDEVTPEDVKKELRKRIPEVQEAAKHYQRVKKSLWLSPASEFLGEDVKAYNAWKEKQADLLALNKNRELHLLGERVREKLKGPEWRDKVGAYEGGTEFWKGLLSASITTGAAWAGATGDKEMLAKLVEGQASLETAYPGSTRLTLEGGVVNDSIKGAQQALGQMVPFLASGLATRIGTGISSRAGSEFAASQYQKMLTGRLGVPGVGMSFSAAGGGYLDTENAIAQALKEGDPERAERIRRGQHWQALFTGVTEGAVERLGAAQAFNVGRRGWRGLLMEIGKEGVEEPLTGVIQRSFVDPVTIRRRADVAGPILQETLTGLLAAGPLVGGSMLLNRGKADKPDAKPEAPDTVSFQAAQNAGSVTDPEPQVTLNQQRELVEKGKKPAMIVDGVKVADLPAEMTGGLAWVDTAAGAVGFRGEFYTEAWIRRMAENPDTLGKLLGYGVGSKPENSDRVVVLEDRDGNEIVSTAADETTVDEVAGNLNVMAEPGLGHAVSVLPADQGGIILEQRNENRKVEANTGRARMAERVLIRAGIDPDVAAFMGARLNDELPGDMAAEAFRDEVLAAFEQAGGVLPGSVALPYVEQQAAYEAQGYSAEEAAVHSQNAILANAAVLAEAREANRRLLENDGRQTNDALNSPKPGENQQLEPGTAIRDKAGQQPGKETSPAGAVGTAEPTAPEAKSRRSLRMQIPKRADGVPDILDWLSEQGAIQRPPPLKRDKMGRKLDQRGEHDGLRSFRESFPAWYRAVTQTRGRPVDVLAQVAFEENVIPSADVDVLLEEIRKAFEQRRHVKAEQRARDKAERSDEKKVIAQGKRQDAAWNKANQPNKGDIAVPSDEMMPGMVLDVDGEPMTVVEVEYDEDGNWEGALLEDGDRFGRQWVSNGEIVYADSVAAPESATVEDDPFAMVDEPMPQEVSGSLWAEEEMPFNLVAETAEDVAKREAAQAAFEKEQREREVEEAKQEAERNQGKLFDDGTMASVRRAQLPRKQTGAGPIRAPGQLVTLMGIRKHLMNAARLPTTGVGRFLQRAYGIYKVKAEALRLQSVNDIPTLTHEIGHAIHFRFLSKKPSGPPESWKGKFDAELMPLGQATSSASYSPAQVRAEGVAEFTRLWLTDPAAAMAAAPTFSAHWYSELQKRAPEVLQGLNEGQRMIADYIAMPDWQKAKAQVVFSPEDFRPRRTWGEWMRRAYATWVNTLQPAQDALAKIGRMDPTLEKTAKRVSDWMENHRGGWQSKANSDLFLNQTDLQGNIIGPGLKAILADIHPADHEDFSTFLALKRAAELERRGVKSGFEGLQIPPAQMQEFERRFEATRQKLLTFQDNVLLLLVDSGLLSKEGYQEMRKANREYVPFYRLFESLTGIRTGVESSRNGGGYVDNNSGLKRMKGSDRAIVDPLQSIMRNVYMFRKLAEQNHIGVQFFDLVKQVQGYGEFADDIVPKRMPTKVSHEEVVKKLIEVGFIADESDLPIGADLQITLWRAMHRPDSKTGEVIVHVDGKPVHWEVKDAMLFNALKTADADAVRLFKNSPVLTKILTIPTQVLRAGATVLNPAFALRNWMRDQVTAGVNSQTGFKPFWDGAIGAIKVARGHPDYARWVAAGGKFSGLTTSDRTYTALIEELMPPDRKLLAMVKGLMRPRHIKRALAITGEILEEATRVQEFSRGISQGLTDMEAANLSKSISLNFARAGETSRTLNMVIAFFNAGVQDLDLVFRQHFDPKRRASVMMKGLLYITLPSVLAWALGKDDPEIQALSETRKNLFWNFNLGPLAKVLGRRGFILSLPKPFLMGQLYGTMVERALDQATGRDPNGAEKAAWAIIENSGVRGDVMNWLPTALGPLVELAMNKDTFREQPIVPEPMLSLPKDAQYTLQTSETAKLLGRATGQSPIVIDHLIEGYFAGLGKMTVGGIDWTMTKLGAGDTAPGPSKDLFEYQPFKSFTGSPYEANAYVKRFYEASSDMEGLIRTWNQQSQLMTDPEKERFWNKQGEEIMSYQQVVNHKTKLTTAGEIRQVAKHMSEINRAMKIIQANREMSPEEKRVKLIELSRQRDIAAEHGFKRLFPERVKKRHY